MPTPVDLNRLREVILANQQRGEVVPVVRERKILVDNQGRIVPQTSGATSERPVSEVPQQVFAALAPRLARDKAFAATHLPTNTQFMEIDGVPGWLFEITDEYRQRYTLFAYHDGSLYQVKVVFPEVEGRYSPHNGHLYADGSICLSPEGGLPTLEGAYAKAVLWATGFTVFRETGQFPFSTNNLNDVAR